MNLDDISIDELFALKDEITLLIDSLDFAEHAYGEGFPEYEEYRIQATSNFLKLRLHIRGVAIAWGIQADFLKEYSEVETRYGLKVSA